MKDLDKFAWPTQWEPLSGQQFQNAQSLSGANVWKNASSKGGGGMFSKANAKGTAGVASALQIGFNALSKLFSKEKKGTPGVSNAPGLGNQLQAGSHDWMKFFT